MVQNLDAAPACPDCVREALKSHDPRLRIELNPRRRCWEILYLRTGYPDPGVVYDQHGKRHPYWALIHRIVDDDGRPRTPDLYDVRLVRSWDTQNTRAAELLASIEAHNAKVEAGIEKQKADMRKEILIDPLWEWAIGRVKVGWTPGLEKKDAH